MLREALAHSLRALGVLFRKRGDAGRRWGRGSQNRVENPGAAQDGACAIRIGRQRQDAGHAEQAAAVAPFGQFDRVQCARRVLPPLHRNVVQLSQGPIQNRELRVEQIQQRKIFFVSSSRKNSTG